MIKKKSQENKSDNFISELWFKFFPYWPLLAILTITFLVPAILLYFVMQPSYTITSALVISELDNRGNDNPSLRLINIYGSQKVVENEVRVLHSRSLMQDVVTDLGLYAPIFEKSAFSNIPAYTNSPIIVRARNPENITSTKESISFEFDETTSSVVIDGENYLLNEWYTFPFGQIRFEINPHRKGSPENLLHFEINDPTKTTEGLLKKLQVTSAGKLSSVINIIYTDVVAERGEDIVARLLYFYNRSSLNVQNQLAGNTLEFAEERIAAIESELDSIERRIQQFRAQEGVIDLSEQGRLYLENISNNEQLVAELNVQLAVLDQVERHLDAETARAGIIPTSLGIDDPVLTLLLERLNELELRYSSLVTTTGRNNPMVRSLESEIEKIRPNIREIISNQRARLQAGLNDIRRTIGGFSSQLRDIPEQERELLEISREQSTKREIYTYLLQRREEAAIAAAATISDIRIFEPPQAGTSPSGSRRLLLFIIAIFFALAATVAYILYREFLNNKMLFRNAVENALDKPVIAEVFHEKEFAGEQRNSNTSRQIFQLQLALETYLKGNKKKKILITSSLPGEGKTFILNHLAVRLASTGKKVVLLDCDKTGRGLTAMHDAKNHPGLNDYFIGKVSIETSLYKTAIPNVDIFPVGEISEGQEVFIIEKLEEIISRLEELYDYVLIDAPALEQASNAYVINQKADITLFVVRHDATPSSILEKLQVTGDIEALKDTVVVFNGVKGRGFLKKYYGFKVGYGYDTPIYNNTGRVRI